MPSEYEHFGDLSPEEHLKEVQDMHKVCKGEPHQTKKGGWYHLASDAIDCGVFIFFIRTVFFLTPTLPLASYGKLLLATGVSWIFYTSCKCAQSAWAYMELTHRNMLQEKKEIEAHPEQERMELRVLYANQGFQEPLLSQMTDFVCSDSSLLLDTMLREELHIQLENYPHPLKQGGMKACGGMLGLLLFFPIALTVSYTVSVLLAALVISALFALKTRLINNAVTPAIVWGVGIFITTISFCCSVIRLF
ncbi:VIT1/CCC1 transporter family protein [Chlamydia suis]|uniref:VIT1/CCC1 transporter family protein n=1 Tax=Chlamydia suis TaxID=83559 RepID=UPI0009B0FD5B|nr:VIT1/CCC1 transporter family protein [Chlamydia suis]